MVSPVAIPIPSITSFRKGTIYHDYKYFPIAKGDSSVAEFQELLRLLGYQIEFPHKIC